MFYLPSAALSADTVTIGFTYVCWSQKLLHEEIRNKGSEEMIENWWLAIWWFVGIVILSWLFCTSGLYFLAESMHNLSKQQKNAT